MPEKNNAGQYPTTLYNALSRTWACSGYTTQKSGWVRSSLGYLTNRVCIHFCCRGGKCKRDLDTACLFLHLCSPEELKLEITELIEDHFIAKKIGWFNECHFWRWLASNQSTKLFWGVRTDPPVRRLDLCMILLFSMRHPDQSVSCIQSCCILLIIRSGPLFTSKAGPTNSEVAQFCARH
jgi:hypothetical protein